MNRQFLCVINGFMFMCVARDEEQMVQMIEADFKGKGKIKVFTSEEMEKGIYVFPMAEISPDLGLVPMEKTNPEDIN